MLALAQWLASKELNLALAAHQRQRRAVYRRLPRTLASPLPPLCLGFANVY